MVNDTISDMLTRIRNANMVKHQIVQIPSTKMSLAIAKILKEEGFIENFESYSRNNKKYLLISLKYIYYRYISLGIKPLKPKLVEL